MKLKIIISFLLIVSIIIMNVHSPRTPTQTTIPPIPAVSSGVVFQCQPFQAFPGSVTPGSSGFILINCGIGNGALSLDGTLTPTLTLGIGYNNSAIVQNNSPGNPCNYHFRNIIVGNVTVPTGSLLNRTLTFSSSPTPGQMLTSIYNYCLEYSNAPSTGLGGFSITWT